MTFYPDGTSGQPVNPHLPPPGWLPDPSETHLERFWDGSRWTTRTRDRATKVENFPHASAVYSSQDWTPRPRRRSRVGRALTTSLFIAVGLGVGYYYLSTPLVTPPEAPPVAQPPAEIVESPEPLLAPALVDVDYPVFGSTELVHYLETAMVAHEESIDVSYWMQEMDIEQIGDALLEAGSQNPYIFVEGWETMQQGSTTTVTTTYVYGEMEAERRRAETYQAAVSAVAGIGADAASDDREKAKLIHDYIVEHAEYDMGAFDSIEAGDTSPRVHQSQEAYGILVMGTAVCNGYAKAFAAMAHEAGLPVVTVTGSDSAGITGGSHAWNKVQIDGEWLLVDTTWDDPVNADVVLYDYFLVEDGDPILDTRITGDEWVVNDNLEAFGA